jgi:hypothetical protein
MSEFDNLFKTAAMKTAVVTVTAKTYLFLNTLVSSVISVAANGLLAWAMYSSSEKILKMSVWGIPNTVAFDLIITTIVQTLITFLISSILSVRDLTTKYPIKVNTTVSFI